MRTFSIARFIFLSYHIFHISSIKAFSILNFHGKDCHNIGALLPAVLMECCVCVCFIHVQQQLEKNVRIALVVPLQTVTILNIKIFTLPAVLTGLTGSGSYHLIKYWK